MLTFLTGTFFSAKKRYISKKISLLIDKGEKVYLIVPEQSSFDRERDFLFTYGEKKSARLTLTSFTRLSRDVLEENGLRVKPEADEAAKNVIMSLAVEDAKDSLNIYGKFSEKLRTVKELIAEYSEIKQAGLGAEELLKVSGKLPEGILKNKTQELSRIFFVYEAFLGERFSDASNNIPIMISFLQKNNIFDGAWVFFDDFRGFTAAQTKLIAEITSQCRESFISVDAPNIINAEDSEAWTRVVKSCSNIRREAAKKNVRCVQKNIDTPHPVKALECIGKSLFCSEKKIFSEKTDAVVFISAENKYSECDTAALEIKKLIDEQGFRCRDIAVAERSGGYAETFAASLKKYGIPVFEDKRVALFDYPLVRMILSAVEIAAFGFSSDRLFSYIKTGVAGISSEECSILENYVYVWNIDRSVWLRPFAGNPEGFGEEMDAEKEKRLTKINEIREKAVSPLQRLEKRLSEGDAENSCRAVYEFLVEINASEEFLKYARFLYDSGNEAGAVERSAVWDIVMQSLDALNAALKGRKASAARFYELLKIIFGSADIGRIPSGIDEIIIGQADRTRFLEPKAVFILGANEEIFPAAAECGGLFSSKEKKRLCKNDFFLENFSENIYAEERMIAYSVITRALEKLYISYSRSSISGEKKEPSVIVSEIKKIVPEAEFMSDAKLSPFDRIGSEESAFEECAAVFKENSIFAASLKEYIRRGKYAQRLLALEAAGDSRFWKIEDEKNAEKLFGKDIYVTPSKAETYYKCPFMYFCRYGMKIKKLKHAELDIRINGLLVHYALEMLFSKNTYEELKNKSVSEIKAEIDAAVENYIEKFMGGRKEKGILFNRSLDKTKNTIFEILSRIILEFGTSRFVIRDTELNIGFGGTIAPYTLSLSGGGNIFIGGCVDRVDVMDDKGKAYLRVIDYKTGGKEFKLSDVFDGLNMQTAIYLMCLWDNGKERYGSVVPAGILYVPAKNVGGNLSRRADKAEIIKNKLKNGRMNGMILEDETVLKGMEKEAEGRFINAYIDKKGVMKGTFISLDDFYLLHKKIDAIVSCMGEKLHSGFVEAFPVIDAYAYKNTCEFCDYSDICRRGVNSPARSPLALRHFEAIKKLREDT